MPIKLHSRTMPRVPVLIACWPGMGHVGIGAASYLRHKLGGTLLAEIDVTPYLLPDAITVENGIGRIPDPPRQHIYYVKEPSLLVFEGDAQVAGEGGIRSATELLDLAKQCGVGTIYTGAAFAIPMSYRHPSKVFGAATDENLKATFPRLGVEPLSEGRISGLNGLLLGLAKSRGISAACFLATMPQYAVETPNPKASKAIIRVFEQILNTSVDMTELDERIQEADQLMGEFESRVAAAIEALRREALAKSEGPGQSEGEPEERPEPYQLMEHIERLFEEAQKDRSKIQLLKDELDRWGLFHLYEDRFLDLFAKHKGR
ncbi:MAG: PAC2 family protein [candidate division WOR-3 bacterium]